MTRSGSCGTLSTFLSIRERLWAWANPLPNIVAALAAADSHVRVCQTVSGLVCYFEDIVLLFSINPSAP